MGIDFGMKRVGIALSDEDGKFALPYATLTNNKDLISAVKKIMVERNVFLIVLGESKNFSGSDNAIMKKIKKFKNDLGKVTKVDVVFEPEFLTSKEASRIQGNVKNLDASAAAIILKSYLSKKNKSYD